VSARPNTFAGAGLDRAGEHRRDAEWIRARREDPAARAIVVGADGILLDGDNLGRFPLAGLAASGAWSVASGDTAPSPLTAAWSSADEIAARVGESPGAVTPADAVLLGITPEGPLFAVDAAMIEHAPLIGLRDAAARLSQAEGGLAAYAAAVLNWHRRHPHCSVCGHRTEPDWAGFVRRCPNCGAEHHPRTDPVVIMLVVDGDRVLMGRQPTWPPKRYSALAGFVEPGESLEEAVAREVREEAGVEIANARYVSSQPWPFPSSLMLGFIADWAGGEPRPRDEVEDARWFDRAEVADAAADRGELKLPPPLAIARQLIEGWLAEG
jgi:NAD+ diphosphatase